MHRIEFETPENVKISYEPAGLGSRFLAWFVDQLILVIVFFLLFIGLLIAGIFVGDLIDKLDGGGETSYYAFGLIALAVGLGNFVYFGLSELFLRGQTVGKRQVHIRVVSADGFALNAGSVFLRNIVRVLDNIPLLWIVPFLSAKGQRLGDIVAGTVVIHDEPKKLTGLRETLVARNANDLTFRFTPEMLRKLRSSDVKAVETLLERRHELSAEQLTAFSSALCSPLAARFAVPEPQPDQRIQFLEDLLTAEYLRRQRQLG